MCSPSHKLAVFALLITMAGCEREEREFNAPPPQSGDTGVTVLSSIAPGMEPPPTTLSATGQKYNENAYHISEGKRWFAWFNCTGCHGHGGGGSGPALMDEKWIYGGSIEHIAATIREGRPNGMPTFGGKIPEQQIWQIAAYVRSMSGNAPKPARPSRNDGLNPGPAEQQREPLPLTGAGNAAQGTR
jgi:cytochrome c oxidase cbb3-type subunit III